MGFTNWYQRRIVGRDRYSGVRAVSERGLKLAIARVRLSKESWEGAQAKLGKEGTTRVSGDPSYHNIQNRRKSRAIIPFSEIDDQIFTIRT